MRLNGAPFLCTVVGWRIHSPENCPPSVKSRRERPSKGLLLTKSVDQHWSPRSASGAVYRAAGQSFSAPRSRRSVLLRNGCGTPARRLFSSSRPAHHTQSPASPAYIGSRLDSGSAFSPSALQLSLVEFSGFGSLRPGEPASGK